MSKILRYFSVLSICFLLTSLNSVVLADTDNNEKNPQTSSTDTSSKDSFQAIFGHMDMFFGMMRTKYKDSRHSLFYPTPQWGGFLGVNYNYFRKFFSLGAGVKFGFYKDRGNPSRYQDHYEKDTTTKLTRPLFPLQATVNLGFTPFVDKFYFIPKKLITFRAWFGYEYLYGQEQRSSGDEDAFVDKVRLSSWVYGVSPWVLISFLDQRTSNSMYVINVKSIYVSPYIEWTRSIKHSKIVSYDRKILGIGLTFETL